MSCKRRMTRYERRAERLGEIPERKGEIPEGRGGWPDRSPVLADRARSECARSMRAVGDRFRLPSWRRYERAWREHYYAGPVADQPSRLRTPPGVGGEGWPVSLLCSRNARPRKGLVGRAQLETNRPTLYMETRASLVGALKAIGCQVSATRCGNYLDQLNG